MIGNVNNEIATSFMYILIWQIALSRLLELDLVWLCS